jgi:hypothetical protein
MKKIIGLVLLLAVFIIPVGDVFAAGTPKCAIITGFDVYYFRNEVTGAYEGGISLSWSVTSGNAKRALVITPSGGYNPVLSLVADGTKSFDYYHYGVTPGQPFSINVKTYTSDKITTKGLCENITKSIDIPLQ